MLLSPHFQGYLDPLDAGSRDVCNKHSSILGRYTTSICKYSHSPSYDQNFSKEILFQTTIRMSLNFNFKLIFFYFTEETLFVLMCKGKVIYFNFFDLMEGVYSTSFHIFHLQPI